MDQAVKGNTHNNNVDLSHGEEQVWGNSTHSPDQVSQTTRSKSVTPLSFQLLLHLVVCLGNLFSKEAIVWRQRRLDTFHLRTVVHRVAHV